ncbi:topoisomerase C-terminal repeat-containing protein [Chryseobacterium tongliaoense]|uniref:topoisomerase C-terminal repeat-containing protein n=1 Tax=Chryseobacterium tongliaoense TaxID=3240933 RepID=UPI0035174D4B
MIIRDKIIKCPDENCNWFQYRNVCGVKLNIMQITSLIKNRKTPIIKNMKAKNGKNFSAFMVLKDDCKTIFEFPDT